MEQELPGREPTQPTASLPLQEAGEAWVGVAAGAGSLVFRCELLLKGWQAVPERKRLVCFIQ